MRQAGGDPMVAPGLHPLALLALSQTPCREYGNGMRLLSPPRLPLAFLPTPLEPMPRLSAALGGPELWVKRDDLTGLAGGGNKTRKLELLMAEARAESADVVLTVGAAQSNHCRQTAAAAARLGLRCVLVLRGAPQSPATASGNVLLDTLCGAEIVWAGERDLLAVRDDTIAAERRRGARPYGIGYGGSSPLGAAAYALAFAELDEQRRARGLAFNRILFATSSGGTQAGLMVGAAAAGFGGALHGVSVDKMGQLRQAVTALIAPIASLLDVDLSRAGAVPPIEIDEAYHGAGYGCVGDAEREAIALVARTEGLLLDPVYTGRAMAGLIDHVRRGDFGKGEKVLFWHTGGTPALFSYGRELVGA